MSVLRYIKNIQQQDLAPAMRIVVIEIMYRHLQHNIYNFVFCSIAPIKNPKRGGWYVVHPRLFSVRFV